MRSRSRRTDRHVLAVVGLVALSAPYLLGSVQHWSRSLLTAGVFVGLAVSLLGDIKRSSFSIPRTPLAYLPIAIILYAVFQTIPLPLFLSEALSPGLGKMREAAGLGSGMATLALNPWAVWGRAFFYVAASVCLLLILRHMRSMEHANWLLGSLILSGVALSLLAYAQSGGRAMTFLPFVNKNHFAGYMEVLAPMAAAMLLNNILGAFGKDDGIRNGVVRAFTGPNALGSAALAAALVFIIASAVLTSSRGGALGILGALLVLAAGLSLKRSNATLLLMSYLALSATVFIVADPMALVDRFGQIDTGGEYGFFGIRSVIWRDSLSMFLGFPVFGVGLGSYETAYPMFKTLLMEKNVFQPDNDYLYVLTEGGLAGFAMLAVFAYMLLAALVKGLAGSGRRTAERCLGAGALGSVAGLAAHGLVDTNFHVPSTLVLLGVICGVGMVALKGGLAGEGGGRSTGYPRSRFELNGKVIPGVTVRGAVMVSLAALVVAVLAMFASAAADLLYRKSVQDIDFAIETNADSTVYITPIESMLTVAGRLSPFRSDIPFEKGRLYLAGYGILDAAGDAGAGEYAERALSEFERSLSINPYSSFGHLIKARTLDTALGRTDAAETEYLTAERLNPTNPLIKSYLAGYYREHGDEALAAEYEIRLPLLDPAYNKISIYDIAQEPDLAEPPIGARIKFKVYAEVMVGELEYRFSVRRTGSAGLETMRDFSTDPVWEWDTAGEEEGVYRVYVTARGLSGNASPLTRHSSDTVYLKKP